MIEAACAMGVIAAGGSSKQYLYSKEYAGALGLAFQIRDDMLDVEGKSDELGKPVGSDKQNAKSTFVSCLGLKRCSALVAEYSEQAVRAAGKFASGEFLQWFAFSLSSRTK